MTKTLGLILAFVLAGTLTASTASAQTGFAPSGNAFGATGQVAISGELEGHLVNGWELRLHPALDYFIATNVSVGGAVGITYHSGNPATTTVELGARVGYNLNIVERVSFWPTVGIFYSHTSSGGTSSGGSSLRIFAPFLYHLVPHLYVGAGPTFTLPLGGGGNGYGIQTVVGGWF